MKRNTTSRLGLAPLSPEELFAGRKFMSEFGWLMKHNDLSAMEIGAGILVRLSRVSRELDELRKEREK